MDTANQGMDATNEGVGQAIDGLIAVGEAVDNAPSITLEENQAAGGGEGLDINSPYADDVAVSGVFATIDGMFDYLGHAAGDVDVGDAFRNGARTFIGVGIGAGILEDVREGADWGDAIAANLASAAATAALVATENPIFIVGGIFAGVDYVCYSIKGRNKTSAISSSVFLKVVDGENLKRLVSKYEIFPGALDTSSGTLVAGELEEGNWDGAYGFILRDPSGWSLNKYEVNYRWLDDLSKRESVLWIDVLLSRHEGKLQRPLGQGRVFTAIQYSRSKD